MRVAAEQSKRRLTPVGWMLGGEFRVAQAAGVSSATWLIGNLGKMN
jgi:hypothetical protein